MSIAGCVSRALRIAGHHRHNWTMTMPGPLGGPSPEQVTDEDRNRFGMLLDSAAERGLLSAADYEVRLGLVAEATSREELQRLVTELPVFGVSTSSSSSAATLEDAARPRSPTPGLARIIDDPTAWTLPPVTRPRGSGRGRGPTRASQWVVLALVVVILAVAMVVLTLMVGHLAPTHGRIGTGQALATGQAIGLQFSPLRL